MDPQGLVEFVEQQNNTSIRSMYVKDESYDSDEEHLAITEEMESMSGDSGGKTAGLTNVVLVDPTNVMDEDGDPDTGALLNSERNLLNRRSQVRFKMVGNEGVASYLSSEDQQLQVLKDDPQAQVHFVKYSKVDNKTLKIWECGTCGKEFRHQYTLMRHLPTHTDERNFKCEVCGKAFRQMSTLSQHRAIHSDARPYVCELCKKTFNRVSTLISHRKTHSEHKPHSCGICGKGFHQKGNLRNHIFTHTNERPYKCETCGKGFNQMSNLMCHKAHSHGTKSPFICTLCNIEFPRKYTLRAHEEYKHGIRYRGGIRIQQVDQNSMRELANRKPRRREDKNLRIIHLPNGDRTLVDINNIIPREHKDGQLRDDVYGNERLGYRKESTDGVIIDPITTKAMITAEREGQTPFALLKPAKGVPVLVKVMPAENNKQMLVPATAEDLKSAGKITVSPNLTMGTSGNNNVKAVQIKVPVVATVIQKVGADGQLTIEVEPPGPEQDTFEQQAQTQAEEIVTKENPDEIVPSSPGMDAELLDKVKEEDEDDDETSSFHLLASTALGVAQRSEEESSTSGATAEQSLLELASHGEIQFVRPSGDGYEVLSQEEAALLMQQPCQTIQIVEDGERPVSNEVIDNQCNLNYLVDAIRAAGFQVAKDQKQLVITPGDETMTMGEEDPSEVQHIVYGEPEEVILSAENDGEDVEIESTDGPVHFILEETGGMISEALEVVSSANM